jgi:aspartyl/asparaginyl beta-hydroxylase (cupin superfamily)/Flp pilus assembly protein TadD
MASQSGDEQRIRALIASARENARRGRPHDAKRLLQQAESEAPRHPLVLNEIALQMLGVGNPGGAAELLERAAEEAPANPEIHFHLAKALRALGRYEEALAAQHRVLEIDPRRIAALLEKGSLEEQLSRQRDAVMSYRAALQMIPPGIQPPPEREPLVRHAQKSVEATNRALEAHIDGALKDLRARFPDEPLHRFEQCVDIMLQKRRIYRQQPTFMYYPELPAIEFYDREAFPWIAAVEAAADDIRDELLTVLADRPELQPYVSLPKGAAMAQWRELNNSRRWSVYSLWNEGKAFPDHIAQCPKTVAALQTVPLWDIPDYGPTVLFSILDAKTRIPAHTGPVNTRLVAHLPLIVPPGCGFRVGGQTRAWHPGEALIFDDSIDHEAWNDSDVPRALLIFSIWKPYLSEAERELTRALTTSIGEFYGTQPGAQNGAELTAPVPL